MPFFYIFIFANEFAVYLRLELDLHNPLVQLQDVIMQRRAKLLHVGLALSHRFVYDVMQWVNGWLQGGKSDYILRRVGDSVGSNQIVHLRNRVLLLFQHSYLGKKRGGGGASWKGRCGESNGGWITFSQGPLTGLQMKCESHPLVYLVQEGEKVC